MNQRPLRPERTGGESETDNSQGLTATPLGACTVACTSNAKNAHGDPAAEDLDGRLDGIAAELLKLSAAERAKLVAMLSERQVEG